MPPRRVNFSRHDIGAEILPILTSGLYRDSLDALREYIQNAIAIHNPMYPFEWQIKSLHMHFEGVLTMGGEYGSGTSAAVTRSCSACSCASPGGCCARSPASGRSYAGATGRPSPT